MEESTTGSNDAQVSVSREKRYRAERNYAEMSGVRFRVRGRHDSSGTDRQHLHTPDGAHMPSLLKLNVGGKSREKEGSVDSLASTTISACVSANGSAAQCFSSPAAEQSDTFARDAQRHSRSASPRPSTPIYNQPITNGLQMAAPKVPTDGDSSFLTEDLEFSEETANGATVDGVRARKPAKSQHRRTGARTKKSWRAVCDLLSHMNEPTFKPEHIGFHPAKEKFEPQLFALWIGERMKLPEAGGPACSVCYAGIGSRESDYKSSSGAGARLLDSELSRVCAVCCGAIDRYRAAADPAAALRQPCYEVMAREKGSGTWMTEIGDGLCKEKSGLRCTSCLFRWTISKWKDYMRWSHENEPVQINRNIGATVSETECNSRIFVSCRPRPTARKNDGLSSVNVSQQDEELELLQREWFAEIDAPTTSETPHWREIMRQRLKDLPISENLKGANSSHPVLAKGSGVLKKSKNASRMSCATPFVL